jgi:hypothetical protein
MGSLNTLVERCGWSSGEVADLAVVQDALLTQVHVAQLGGEAVRLMPRDKRCQYGFQRTSNRCRDVLVSRLIVAITVPLLSRSAVETDRQLWTWVFKIW